MALEFALLPEARKIAATEYFQGAGNQTFADHRAPQEEGSSQEEEN